MSEMNWGTSRESSYSGQEGYRGHWEAPRGVGVSGGRDIGGHQGASGGVSGVLGASREYSY